MSSTAGADLDLERDLPTTPADSDALRKHRPGAMTSEQYLAFLRRVVQVPADRRPRPGPRGEPFEL